MSPYVDKTRDSRRRRAIERSGDRPMERWHDPTINQADDLRYMYSNHLCEARSEHTYLETLNQSGEEGLHDYLLKLPEKFLGHSYSTHQDHEQLRGDEQTASTQVPSFWDQCAKGNTVRSQHIWPDLAFRPDTDEEVPCNQDGYSKKENHV